MILVRGFSDLFYKYFSACVKDINGTILFFHLYFITIKNISMNKVNINTYDIIMTADMNMCTLVIPQRIEITDHSGRTKKGESCSLYFQFLL